MKSDSCARTRNCCAVHAAATPDLLAFPAGTALAMRDAMIENLLSSPTTGLLEKAVSFTERRNNVLVDDIANVDTPGFIQKDLDVAGFQESLRAALQKKTAPAAAAADSDDDVVQQTSVSPVFHDRGVRRIETLMGDLADNAIAHNTAAQLLKFQYDMVSRAISMKV